MPYLVAAVAVVGVLCLLDLLLTVAAIRRLRDHTERLDRLSARRETDDGMLAVGTPLPSFETTSTTGTTVTAQDFSPGVVALLSVNCAACKEQLPHFTEYVERSGLPSSRVFVLIEGDESPARDAMAATLEASATVVAENYDGTVRTALDAAIFPTFYSIDESGAITTASLDAAGLAKTPATSSV